MSLLLLLPTSQAFANGNGSLGQSYAANLSGGGMVTQGAGLRSGLGGRQPATIRIAGIPSGATIEKAFLYVVFITRNRASYDATWTFAGRSVSGTRIGYHGGTCWGFGNNVTLRADVTSRVTGNGSFSLSGIASNSTYQPQGASLVVVYKDKTSGQTARVMIRDGTIAGSRTGQSMATTFSGFRVGSSPTRATFHVAMGDSQPFPTSPLAFNGTNVIAANAFRGTDGGGWDDFTVNVKANIPSGDTSFPVSTKISSDCLVWPYTAVTYSTCSPKTWYRDADGDTWGGTTTRSACTAPSGYVSRGGDCNDGARTIYPGAREIIGDQIDQSCDGKEICYLDNDNDKWRLTSTIVSADADCVDSREAAASVRTLDCDDNDARTYPGATEIVGDNKDQSCDGKEVCYIDFDNDNWRLNTTLVSADADCRDPGEGMASDPAVDCDDRDPKTYPGATEIVGDEKDQSCDGKELCYADADFDTYRATTTVVSADADCRDRGEARFDVAIDCDDRDAKTYPGAAEIVGDNKDQSCDGKEICYNDYDDDKWRLNSTIVSADADCRDTHEGEATDKTLDCDDRDPKTYPGATEIVGDEKDQSCDGKELCYTDADDDGWRLDTSVVSADADCRDAGEARASEPRLDCDDRDPKTYPGAPEIVGDEKDQSCDGKELCYADGDGDGWRTSKTVVSADADCKDSGEATATTPGIDCDDARKETYPGADEYCNGFDDDCDKVIDEDDALDAGSWYRDSDGDTYGDVSVSKKACKVPTGYVADDTDCDDKRKETFPGADEYCNGIDDDCDKVIDEDDAIDAKTWYEDADGDTYGNPAVSTKACKVPTGYTADDTDCDDTDKGTYPGAPEIPYDGIDQDCDGDDLCDVDVDGYDDPLCGGSDCDDKVDTINPGADEIWYDGVDQDCDNWSDYDSDFDGFDSADYEGDDCDDTDETINPDADEIWYDGVDQDCDGESDYDADGDGYDSSDYGGEDCDDDDDTVYPGAEELDDGIDNDCNGVDETTDTDGDGIPDEVELDIGTDPLDADTDGDGVMDGDEVGDWDEPTDTDGDGTIDPLDVDDDGDGILTEVEIGVGPGDDPVDSDGDETPDYLDLDSDDDGFLDEEEGLTDTDGDGVSDYLDLDSDGDSVLDERELHEDTDGDGADDRVDSDDDGDGFMTEVEEQWEDKDLDGDGIDNYLDVDSDGDGRDDIDEGGEDQDCDGSINVTDADDYDGPCATADSLTYQSGACGGASTTGAPLGGAGLLLGLLGLLGVRRRRYLDRSAR